MHGDNNINFVTIKYKPKILCAKILHLCSSWNILKINLTASYLHFYGIQHVLSSKTNLFMSAFWFILTLLK